VVGNGLAILALAKVIEDKSGLLDDAVALSASGEDESIITLIDVRDDTPDLVCEKRITRVCGQMFPCSKSDLKHGCPSGLSPVTASAVQDRTFRPMVFTTD